mgnify:CR=1 FL=1
MPAANLGSFKNLFTTEESFTSFIFFDGKTKVTALATGRGSGNFDARLPRELDVSINDTVTFPELNKQVLAVVEAIEVTPNDSFQRILFKSPINIAEIRFVEVDMNIDR